MGQGCGLNFDGSLELAFILFAQRSAVLPPRLQIKICVLGGLSRGELLVCGKAFPVGDFFDEVVFNWIEHNVGEHRLGGLVIDAGFQADSIGPDVARSIPVAIDLPG